MKNKIKGIATLIIFACFFIGWILWIYNLIIAVNKVNKPDLEFEVLKMDLGKTLYQSEIHKNKVIDWKKVDSAYNVDKYKMIKEIYAN